MKESKLTMDKLVSHCKSTGIVYPGSDIYDGGCGWGSRPTGGCGSSNSFRHTYNGGCGSGPARTGGC